MIIAEDAFVGGDRVALLFTDDSVLELPAAYGWMHDPDGKDWPKCSLLIGPFKRTGKPLDAPRAARSFLGHRTLAGRTDLPARALEGWDNIGRVVEILYTRHGDHANDFKHGFASGWWFWKKPRPVPAYQRGSFTRLELGRGCKIDFRGLVSP
jgi:hypothetical protein